MITCISGGTELNSYSEDKMHDADLDLSKYDGIVNVPKRLSSFHAMVRTDYQKMTGWRIYVI